MHDSEAFFRSRLEYIRSEGRYRTFADQRWVGAYPRAYALSPLWYRRIVNRLHIDAVTPASSHADAVAQ
jgi:hypothetical protein